MRRAWPVNWRVQGYHINTGGRLVIEFQAEMAKRCVASPDDADALALTFACSVAAESVVTQPTLVIAAQRFPVIDPRLRVSFFDPPFAECAVPAMRGARSDFDRENRFFAEDLEELRVAGYLLIPIPSSLGGGG
jgi:hypothetical protein